MSARWILAAAAVLLPAAAQAQPVGTAFTYQGRLTSSGSPANGPIDLRFLLFDSPAAGAQVGPTIDRPGTSLTGGLFTVALDFGPAAFAGSKRWLEIRVSPAGAGAYTTLSPRQELTPSPSAVFSSTTANAPWSGVTGKPPGFADDTDNDTTYSAGAGLNLAGTAFSIAPGGVTAAHLGQNGCGPNQILKWNGAAWACAADSSHDHFTQAWTGASAGAGFRVTNSGGGGILGVSSFPDGNGVHGRSTATTGAGWGVFGESPSPNGAGVSGYGTAASGPAIGVLGVTSSPTGRGVSGVAQSAAGSSFGVRGESPSPIGFGVAGYGTATSGSATGVLGVTASPSGHGVRGVAGATTGTSYGVRGVNASPDGVGVYGEANATSGGNRGVIGTTTSPSGIGVLGKTYSDAGTNFGVVGANTSPDGVGVYGVSEPTSGVNFGVYGVSNSPAGYAGFFAGQVQVTGTLSKGGGSFKIDHPLDPENKYLYHSFVESPDMMNVYNGNAVTDADGSATVELPEWFEALNRDFRYQLTAIGAPARRPPRRRRRSTRTASASREGRRACKVSWQVTGIRQRRLRGDAPHPGGGGQAGEPAGPAAASRGLRPAGGEGPRQGAEAAAVKWMGAVVLAFLTGSAHAQPAGTAFTYQGRLTSAGNPASGAYDLRFVLFDAAGAGAPGRPDRRPARCRRGQRPVHGDAWTSARWPSRAAGDGWRSRVSPARGGHLHDL